MIQRLTGPSSNLIIRVIEGHSQGFGNRGVIRTEMANDGRTAATNLGIPGMKPVQQGRQGNTTKALECRGGDDPGSSIRFGEKRHEPAGCGLSRRTQSADGPCAIPTDARIRIAQTRDQGGQHGQGVWTEVPDGPCRTTTDTSRGILQGSPHELNPLRRRHGQLRQSDNREFTDLGIRVILSLG